MGISCVMDDKVRSYIGFAVKASKVVYGIDNILQSPKSILLVLYDSSLSSNAVSKAKLLCDTRNIQCIQLQDPIQDLVYKYNCKVIGIKDSSLSRAIVDNLS